MEEDDEGRESDEDLLVDVESEDNGLMVSAPASRDQLMEESVMSRSFLRVCYLGVG